MTMGWNKYFVAGVGKDFKPAGRFFGGTSNLKKAQSFAQKESIKYPGKIGVFSQPLGACFGTYYKGRR